MKLTFFAVLVVAAAVAVAVVECKLRKCCPDTKVLDVATESCLEHHRRWPKEQLERDFRLRLGLGKDLTINATSEAFGIPECEVTKELKILLNVKSVNNNVVEYVSDDNTPDEFIIDDTSNYELVHIETGDVFKDFCYDRAFNSELEFVGTATLACVSDPEKECMARACIRFCCPQGYRLSKETGRCEESIAEILSHFEIASSAKIFNGFPTCAPLRDFDAREVGFEMSENGSVTIQNITFRHTEYCVDALEEGNATWTFGFMCAQQSNTELVEVLVTGLMIVKVIFVVSIVSLLAAFVHIFVKNRQKLFGVMTLSMIAMLFLFYGILAIPSFLDINHIREQPLLCKIEAVCIQFSYISAMCWLSAMSFDIWSTFRRLSSRPHDTQGRGWRHPRFKWYALWSWGIPSVVCIVTVIMELLPPNITAGLKLPEIGQTRCFLGNDGIIFYFHIINLPLLLANLVLFSLSSWNLCCGIWGQSNIIRNQTKARAKTVAKLFFVMGLTWIAEIISWFLLHHFPLSVTIVKASLFFDCINALQGFTLFCTLFFDQATLKKIRWVRVETTSLWSRKPTRTEHSATTVSNLQMAEVSDQPNKSSNQTSQVAETKKVKREGVASTNEAGNVSVFKSNDLQEENGARVRNFAQLMFKRKQGSYTLNS